MNKKSSKIKSFFKRLFNTLISKKSRKIRIMWEFIGIMALIIFSISSYFILIFVKNERIVLNWVTSILVLFTIAILFFWVDVVYMAFDFIEDKYYSRKAKNMMDSYRNWVFASNFGKTYHLLDYLSRKGLTEFINEKNQDYLKEKGNSTSKKDYVLWVRDNKDFEMYNGVIIRLSKKPLAELKNMLSFIELTPKKSWFLALVKTIVLLFIPTVTIGEVTKFLKPIIKKTNSLDFFTMSEKLVNFFTQSIDFSNNGTRFGLSIILLYALLFIFVFSSIYKDTKFDEPHIRKYLKSSITRAIEIKENGEETEPF